MTNSDPGFSPCPICGGTERQAKWSQWTACARCGALLRDPWPDPHELKEIYQEAFQAEEPTRGTMKATSERLAKEYVRLILSLNLLRWPPRQKILDFGAGFGHMSRALQGAGHEVRAVEPYGAETLRQGGIEAFQSLNELYAIKNGSVQFHGAVMIEVLEHLPDPVAVLQELRRILLPGGWLLATTPNAGGLRARLLGSSWQGASKPSHLILFSGRVAVRAFGTAGFKDIRLLRLPIRFSDRLLRGSLQSSLQLVGLGGNLKVLATVPE